LEKTEIPNALPAEEVSDITIIVGENYKYTPIQYLVPTS
jgi:hypothetical protein